MRSVNIRRNRMDIVLAVSPLEAALWIAFVAIGTPAAVVAFDDFRLAPSNAGEQLEDKS